MLDSKKDKEISDIIENYLYNNTEFVLQVHHLGACYTDLLTNGGIYQHISGCI